MVNELLTSNLDMGAYISGDMVVGKVLLLAGR